MWSFVNDILQDDIIKVLLSLIVGALIGAEREYSSKSAGFRTMILISIGSTVFTILSIRIGVNNPDRLAANILTGVGFLGAGVIFRTEKKALGLTTASTIWISAALGMAIGSGHVILALLVTVVVLSVLLGFRVFQNIIDKASHTQNYKIDMEYNPEYIGKFKLKIKEFGLKVKDQSHVRAEQEISSVWVLHGKSESHEIFKKEMLNDFTIKRFEF